MAHSMLHIACRLLLVCGLWICAPSAALSQEEADSTTLSPELTNTSFDEASATSKRKPFFSRMISPFVKFFTAVDTNYISPSEYNFQALEQVKYNYETYRIKSEGMGIGFSPRKSLKIGPYIGWSIIFVGVTVDLFHMSDESNRKEWDLSLYTLPFVLDIYYRIGGSVCTIDYLRLGEGVDTSPAVGLKFDEFSSDIYGFNFTYIFNHKKFSYPAAYNQGAPQRRSSGSFLAGIGFTQHSLSVDWGELTSLIGGHLGPDFDKGLMDTLRFDKITYSDLSLSGGYAFNYVFARNWLLAASMCVGVSYKYASSSTKYIDDIGQTFKSLRDFKFRDISFDLVARAGIVYNTGKWFVGASAIFNSYNYTTKRFNTSSNFGTVNVYGGFNFGRKKQYRTNKI